MNKTLSDCSSSLPSKPYFSTKIGIGHQERAGAVLEKSCDIRVKMNEEQTVRHIIYKSSRLIQTMLVLNFSWS